MPPPDFHRETNRKICEGWIDEHRGIIVKIVRGFTTDPTDGADLTQDICLALWRSVSSFRGDAAPSTWIWRIALNQAIAWQRKAAPPTLGLDEIVELHTLERVDEGLLIDHIYDAIRTLAPVDRSLIMLSLDGYRYAEMSEITGLTESNVGARLTRARLRLTQQLEEIQ